LRAIREGNLAQALCLCRNQRECADWSFRLTAFLQTVPRARGLNIPANFPDFKILPKYYRPKVTSDDILTAKKSLDLSNARTIDERKLLNVTSSRFNVWGRLYMNWVTPVLLTRSLSHRSIFLPKEVVHDIKLPKQRVSKSEEVKLLRSLERKITFSPFEVTSLRREDFEGGERQWFWDGKRDVPFDPTHRVECDYFPAFWLQRVLPRKILIQLRQR
jgi:Holliday junction resolvase YEN1